ANGSLMRVSPIGIWAAGDPARAAKAAREDSALTHPHPACVESCAAYVAAIAIAVGGGNRDQMLDAALAEAKDRTVVDAIRAGVNGEVPADFMSQQGWVLIALQNAFFQLFAGRGAEEAIVSTVGRRGDTGREGDARAAPAAETPTRTEPLPVRSPVQSMGGRLFRRAGSCRFSRAGHCRRRVPSDRGHRSIGRTMRSTSAKRSCSSYFLGMTCRTPPSGSATSPA